MKSFMLLVAICLVGVTEGMPLHASCKANWTSSLKCTNVLDKLVGQIGQWTGPDGCANGGEKCLYKLVSRNTTQVKATHETPKKHYVDDLTFTFTQDTSKCNITGLSSSETWYAVLDYGTNYCNLHNLIVGSGLDKSPGYSETTSNSICTQFTSADCSKY
ncbi:uncharacterized protein LOC124259459 [Haliotis rubra]|uniref:uncharacterized protein LOC124259459 n=1 Tax=Haliotis rubra TaxID=36100 RepID=UPI001EE53180|nr:uncharacterized protein LOC124259459 [Haliotis rubra]